MMLQLHFNNRVALSTCNRPWIHEGGDAKSMRQRIAHAEEIAQDLWRVKAAWFNHAMTAGIDGLLERYINLVEPVYPKDLGILQFEQFRKEHAVAFFSPRKRCADKGRFWKVVSGSYANRVALVMCFGKSWLHVGLLPLQDGKIGDGTWAENLQTVTLRLKNHPISDKASRVEIFWCRPPANRAPDGAVRKQ